MSRAAHVWRGRRALALVWTVLVLGASVGALAPVSPASAHTGLVSATPSAGSTVDGVPSSVELEFSSPVQARLAQVVVSDADGHDHVVGPVASFDSRVAAQLEGLRAGGYTVAYRVVAADGHPVVGRYEFVVSAGAVSGSPTDAAATGGAEQPASGDGRPWLVPLLGALAVVAAGALRALHGGRRAAP